MESLDQLHLHRLSFAPTPRSKTLPLGWLSTRQIRAWHSDGRPLAAPGWVHRQGQHPVAERHCASHDFGRATQCSHASRNMTSGIMMEKTSRAEGQDCFVKSRGWEKYVRKRSHGREGSDIMSRILFVSCSWLIAPAI